MRSNPPTGIIVIEGADSAGKTTLANHIRERFPNTRYLHSTRRKDIWRYHVGALRWACRESSDRLVILDRHWISELVYGPIFRGRPAYDEGAAALDRMLMSYGALYVICAPSNVRAQLQRHADRRALGKEMFTNIERVVQFYLNLATGSQIHPGTSYLDRIVQFGEFAVRSDVLRYDLDTNGDDLNGFVDRILYNLHARRLFREPTTEDWDSFYRTNREYLQ